jgi:hypothetical protein
VTAEEWVALVAGIVLIAGVLFSALRTVVLPQGGLTHITRFVFALADRIFTSAGTRRPLPRRMSSLYAPVALASLPFAWSMLIAFGFALVFWARDVGSLSDAWVTSGSSLFTLGFAEPDGTGLIWLTFVEATIGLGIVALLISYLPTLYTAYSAREQGVGLLEPLVGSPPAGPELLRRLHTAHALEGPSIWMPTSAWFVAMTQNHTAFPALSRFPPQQEDQSWVVTAGVVLDAASILVSVVDLEGGAPAVVEGREVTTGLGPLVLVLAHGIPGIVRVGRAAGLAVDDPPPLVELATHRGDEPPSISIEREEYDAALELLLDIGVIAAVDAEQGWHRYAWLRSGYDRAIRGLAGLTHAPPAPWTSDRALKVGRPRFFSRRPMATSEA